MTEAERYAREVIEGKVIAGKLIILACQRFLLDLERDDIYLDTSEGDKIVDFVEENLRHWEGKWRNQPMILERWQKFIIQQIFGWRVKETGLRRIKSAYIQIARKNAKSTLAAAIALYHLFIDSENAPQVYVGSNNEDQSKICVNTAGQIIKVSPVLKSYVNKGIVKLFTYKDKVVSISNTKNNGLISTLTADAETKDGFNPSLGIIDEYHEAKDDSMLNVIESGQGAREQPLLVTITTAGFNKEGPCYSKLRHTSVELLEGKIIDDNHLAIIYEMDEGDDWKDSTKWFKCSPNWGVSVLPGYMESRLTKAVNEGGSKQVDFKTKNLNMWVDAPVVWITTELWNTNSHNTNPAELAGKMCYGGLDLASSDDLNAFVLWFPLFDGKHHAVLPYFWIPEEKVENHNDRVDYKRWVEQGFIKQTPGAKADHDVISDDIIELQKKYDLKSISYDRRYFHHTVARRLTETSHEFCHDIPQDVATLNFPMRELAGMIKAAQLEHFNNPIMKWMMGNVIVYTDSSGNIKPDRKKSRFKIDGVAAMLNAFCEYKTFEGQEIDLTFTAIK